MLGESVRPAPPDSRRKLQFRKGADISLVRAAGQAANGGIQTELS